MFSKILIANRGEIAVRIIRACKEMGIKTVAVYSEADREALHVSMADESYCIGPAPAKDSYLNVAAILTAAVASGVQAIHPGYGLLSENAKFARLCESCNITFIGPSANVISSMGDKNQARKTMIEAGVPVIPGCQTVQDAAEALSQAEQIGYPLLIKAKAGGGGRGIRKVESARDVEKAFYSATAEAMGAFGDGGVYLEKFLSPVKHVEVQLIGDNYGNVVALGERDCSMQRKNQKLIEESPCSLIDEETRNKMCESACLAAKKVGYTGAGTVEFLLDQNNNYYFMEMNTRLQVEHPVTEMVTGLDLVKWQIRVAAGVALDFTQEDVQLRGCAIECRINADNTAKEGGNGSINLLHIPGGHMVRFDSAIFQGYKIPPFYDSMIGKLIVHANTRNEAVRKMRAALGELIVGGVNTNIEQQLNIISHREFADGTYSTDLVLREGL